MEIQNNNTNQKVYRTKSIHLRCTREEYGRFQQAAKEANTSLNTLITSTAQDKKILDSLIEFVRKNQK